MTKPRIFVSSTYYDLKHIRSSLVNFIENMGYESILFEKGDIPYKHQIPLDESCNQEIDNSHMFILIVGGRYGSPSSKKIKKGDDESNSCNNYNSITINEYRTAREKDIPIFIFVEKNVYSEYRTYKENRDVDIQIKYAYVDNVNVFKLLDEITTQDRNNPICDFDKFEDISNWLREQWAGLFADFLLKQHNDKSLEDMSTKIEELSQITGTLKQYTESIMKKVEPDDYKRIIKKQDEKMEQLKEHIFASERVIRFIMHNDENIITENLYPAFKKAKTLEEFAEMINLKKEVTDVLLDSRIRQLEYKRLRSRLLIR